MVVAKRQCRDLNASGDPCGYAPIKEKDVCFWHDPDSEEQAREARRLGGIRRRREGILQGTYDFGGLASVEDLRRVLEIAAMDALALDNSVARVRALTSIVQVGSKLLEVGELEDRLVSLERIVEQGGSDERGDQTD